MWRVFFVNFGYFSANEGKSVEEAVKIARRAGFDAQIYSPSEQIVATYDVIGGLRWWDRRYAA
jgi:hypothetical protein